MRVGALSDVHGNVAALEAVLRDVDAAAVDLIVFGGDLAAGPQPNETLAVIRSLGERARFVRGNADREVVTAFDGEGDADEEGGAPVSWVAGQIDRDDRDFLASLPERMSLSIDGLGDTLFCHGSPRTDMEILTAGTPDERLRDAVDGVREGAVVCGHTHMQFDRTIDGKRVLNPGSVGLPYEGTPGAYWAILGPEVEFRQSPYDSEAAAERIRATSYPGVDEFVEELILSSTARNEAIEFFEDLARKDPRFAGA